MTPPYTVSVAEEAGVPSPPSLAEEVAGAQKEEREASAVSVRNLARPPQRWSRRWLLPWLCAGSRYGSGVKTRRSVRSRQAASKGRRVRMCGGGRRLVQVPRVRRNGGLGIVGLLFRVRRRRGALGRSRLNHPTHLHVRSPVGARCRRMRRRSIRGVIRSSRLPARAAAWTGGVLMMFLRGRATSRGGRIARRRGWGAGTTGVGQGSRFP